MGPESRGRVRIHKDSKGDIMKEYELTVLLRPGQEEAEAASLQQVRDIITQAGGSITSEDAWGKKRLAYKIQQEDFAHYVYFELSLPAQAPLKISNTFNITDDVLRYLLVTVNHKGRQALADAAKKAPADTQDAE